MPNQIVIRTMKDDIAEMNQPPAPVVSDPAPAPKSNKEITPPIPVHGYKHIAIGIGYILLFICIIASGVYGYLQWGAPLITDNNTSTKEASFFELVPKEALVVVDYNIEMEESRTAIESMWNEAKAVSESSGLEGDPRNLMDHVDVPHINYVLMPDSPQPFFVVKKTEMTKEYVSQQREEQVLEKDGWYVLHTTNVEPYSAALEHGAIAEESLLVTPSGGSTYLVRYAMSAAFLRTQFQSLAPSALGFSGASDVVFYVSNTQADGVVRMSAQIAGDPPGEGVVNDTAELLSLIPSDIHYAQIGLNFAEKISTLEEESAQLDTTILTQPAVRQFISLFATPYAMFERKGSDGVTDIGLIIALPTSLQRRITVGEPILEQALPALIPLVIGKRLDVQIVFNDGLYEGVPLRYVNLNGQTKTIDYAVGDNFLLISSSREGMSALVDTLALGKQGISAEDPFKALGEKAAAIIRNRTFIVGSLTGAAIKSVLPVSGSTGAVPFIISSGKTSTGIDIQAVLESK